jgi:hypothetical protein
MGRRKRNADADQSKQASFAWADRARILANAPDGEVIFEAPELRPTRARKSQSSPPPPRSLGLPFGVHHAVDGTPACWSCGQAVDETRVVRVGPGDSRCPGCGAKLPFH